MMAIVFISTVVCLKSVVVLLPWVPGFMISHAHITYVVDLSVPYNKFGKFKELFCTFIKGSASYSHSPQTDGASVSGKNRGYIAVGCCNIIFLKTLERY